MSFQFRNVPTLNEKSFLGWLQFEFKRLSDYLLEINPVAIRLQTTSVEPSKPSNGEIRYADGTSWDPGAGRGLYIYNNGGSPIGWEKL